MVLSRWNFGLSSEIFHLLRVDTNTPRLLISKTRLPSDPPTRAQPSSIMVDSTGHIALSRCSSPIGGRLCAILLHASWPPLYRGFSTGKSLSLPPSPPFSVHSDLSFRIHPPPPSFHVHLTCQVSPHIAVSTEWLRSISGRALSSVR